MTLAVDVITIFPDYFAPLSLSLPGKAIADGRVRLTVHDLRDWTDDRHRSVDDTPYGGGAGMIMKAEPWGRALDAVVPDGPDGPDGADGADARLLIMTPSGRRFDQALAAELATESHLVIACGRYEGFDARIATDAARRMRVDEVSLGDYVLNGGEVAALAVLEAVIRLLPGVVGNPESLTEESHADGLLEYPGYTKPLRWRDLDVPEVLLSGHHANVARWRQEQALARTRERRPDLLVPPPGELLVRPAEPGDAGELLTVLRAAYVTEAQLNGTAEIPPLRQTLAELRASLHVAPVDGTVLVAHRDGRLVGSVRGEVRSEARGGARAQGGGAEGLDRHWYVGRLVVAPDLQGEGIGSALLAAIEAAAPKGLIAYRLFTGARSPANLRFYATRGYREVSRTERPGVEVVVMEKPAPC